MPITLTVEKLCITSVSDDRYFVYRVEDETHCCLECVQWDCVNQWHKRHHDKKRSSRSRFAGTIVRRNVGVGCFRRFALMPYEIERPFIAHMLGERLSSRMHETCWRFDRESLPVSPTAMAKNYLGCTLSALVEKFEDRFEDGMDWNNFGPKGWVIDHILPVSRFDFRKISHIRKACHHSNLRPCWAIENIRKGNRLMPC